MRARDDAIRQDANDARDNGFVRYMVCTHEDCITPDLCEELGECRSDYRRAVYQ